MSKQSYLTDELRKGWITVGVLLAMTNWKPHTLRSVLSRMGNVERKREDGVTSYRLKPEDVS